MQTATRFLVAFCSIGLILILNSCDRIPQAESRFQACLANEWTGGEDILPALRELEQVLMSAGHLEDRSKSAYLVLLENLNTEALKIDPQDIAPKVRDFWFLSSPATFRAYPYCVSNIVSSDSELEHKSLLAMHDVYTELEVLDEEESILRLDELVQHISDDDFENILFRGAVLVQLLRVISR